MSQILISATNQGKKRRDNFKEGCEFEEYIINLFNEQHFQLRKHRRSQPFNGVYFEDASNPDIEMELVFSGTKKYKFAVECKWRSEFKNGVINWAEDGQICNYQMFQDRVRIPVFIAIGVGGEPGKPDKLFVTPLNNICGSGKVFEKELIPFVRKATHRFYYDYVQLRLF